MDEALRELADRMRTALATGVATDTASSQGLQLAVADAYRVQHAVLAARSEDGDRVRGYKVAMRTPPLVGEFLAGDVVRENDVIPTSGMVAPRIEAELAFVIGEPLRGDRLLVTDVLRATAFVLPAFEVVDSRLVGGIQNPETDLIADNAMFAAAVLGGPPTRVDAHDIRGVEVQVMVDGDVVESGLTGKGSVNPAHGVMAVAAHLYRHGRGLEPGDVVLTGSCNTPVAVSAGNVVTARFGELGSVSVAFGE